MRKTLAALFSTVAFACGGAIAAPATVEIKMDSNVFGTIGHQAGTIHYRNADNDPWKRQGVHAGRFVGTSSTPEFEEFFFTGSVDEVFTYCYDVHNYLAKSSTTYNVLSVGTGIFDQTRVFLHGVNLTLSASGTYDPYAWLRPTSAGDAAAIQLGIWESMFDGSFDLLNGNFKVSGFQSTTLNQSAAFFAAADGQKLSANYIAVFQIQGSQDLITGRLTNNVPSPATLLLMLPALAGLMISTRRRRQS